MSEAPRFSFDAGALCLDFANTCGDRPVNSEDRLVSSDDLLRWGVEAGLVTDAERGRWSDSGTVGHRALLDAVELREAIYATCSALAGGHVPPAASLARINAVLRDALPNLELGFRGDGCCWTWTGSSSLSDRILWPVARSIADLLTSDETSRLRECAAEDCSWLFLDMSRNRRRKWCSMASCGNRAKARRHYARRTRGS